MDRRKQLVRTALIIQCSNSCGLPMLEPKSGPLQVVKVHGVVAPCASPGERDTVLEIRGV